MQFKKGIEHGPHSNYMVHLASCYMGPRSHAAKNITIRAMEVKDRLGTDFPHDPEFGNTAIQGGSKELIGTLLGTSGSNITLTVNTHQGLIAVSRALQTDRTNVLLYRSEYLDVKTPFVKREDVGGNLKAVYINGARDSKGRPLGFDLAEFEAGIKKYNPAMVVISHVQFPNSFTVDLRKLSKICKDAGVPLVVDVAQSFGVLNIMPEELGLSAVVAPLWKWVGGHRGTAFLYTSPELRAQLKPEWISASGIVTDGWLTDVDQAPLRSDAGVFTTSTLPTEDWIPTRQMLSETKHLCIANIEEENRMLQALARNNLHSPRIELFETGELSLPGSFLAFKLSDDLYGKEEEVVARLKSLERKVDITARGGFLRVAPHHFISEDDLVYACRKICETVDSL